MLATFRNQSDCRIGPADKAAPKIATKAYHVKPVKLNGFTITITATKIKSSHLPAPLGTRFLKEYRTKYKYKICQMFEIESLHRTILNEPMQ